MKSGGLYIKYINYFLVASREFLGKLHSHLRDDVFVQRLYNLTYFRWKQVVDRLLLL